MKSNLRKILLLTTLSLGTVFYSGLPAKAGSPMSFHSFIIGASTDVGTTIGRLISTAVKYFLSDDTELEAQLVYKDGKSCGGCYGGSCSAQTEVKLSAVLSDISIDTELYQGIPIEKNCVADLAQKRLDASVRQRQAALEDLTERDWQLQYQSQRRAIQAMTNALNLKRLYNEIKDVATSTPSDFADYSAALSSVASKRLLLDQLLALKKRVIAARVITRAQTLDLVPDVKRITVAPDLSDVCEGEPVPPSSPSSGPDEKGSCKRDQYYSQKLSGCQSCIEDKPHGLERDISTMHSERSCLCESGYEWEEETETCVVQTEEDEENS